MIPVTPEGAIYLCRTPLEKDYKHQLTFTNAAAQANYFQSTVKRTATDFVYVRKDKSIVVDMLIDDIRDCNYLFYKNTGYTSRIFYCFITGMEYISDESTRIYFDTDVIQTWYFDMDFKRCFVEREHVNDDIIGHNTVPEGLDLGETHIVELKKIPISNTWKPCFVCSDFPENITTWFTNDPKEIGGVFTGMKMFAVNSLEDAETIVKLYSYGTGDAIKNIFMIPSECVTSNAVQWVKLSPFLTATIYQISQNGYTSSGDNTTMRLPKDANNNHILSNGYIPKNKKLFTYPYSYMYLDNNAGSQAIYKWEDFPLNSAYEPVPTYYKAIIPSASLSARLFFKTYKNFDSEAHTQIPSEYNQWRAYSYGLTFGKVPVCAWTTDYYTNWLTQNGLSLATSIVTGGADTYVTNYNPSSKTGNAIAAASTGVNMLGNTLNALAQMHKASIIPDQAHGDINTGDFSFAYYGNGITCYKMSIRPEYAAIIDNFFSMYGYKVNTVKTPSITGRKYWNYIKTIDCNIEGNIPQDDLEKIRGIFNTGCTFWHGATNMFNYQLDNTIL